MSASPAPIPHVPTGPPAPPGTALEPTTAGPVRVYRSATRDIRGRILLVALVLYVVYHVVMGGILSSRIEWATITGVPLPVSPDAPVWFSTFDLQVGIQAIELIGGSFLQSAALQIGAFIAFFAGLVVLMNHRLRIIALLFPAILFTIAALLQCVSYNIHHWYWVQLNPIATLLFGLASFLVTARYAPRNSGWRDLRVMLRDFARGVLTNPGAQLFGPIFGKEVRVLGRRRSTYVIRALYPLALIGLATIIYVSAALTLDRTSSGAERLQRLQEMAPALTLFIAWAQYVMLLFLAASITSSAICDERRTRSLASLMTTPMTATQIVMGKLSSRLVQLIILACVSVPFLLGVRVFGGLEAEVIVGFLAITISSVFLMASLGVLASVWSRKSAPAAAFAMILYVLVSFGPFIIFMIMAANGGAMGALDEVVAVSSPASMMALTVHISGGGGPRVPVRDLWIANSVVNISLGIGAVFLASICLRAVMLSENALEAPKRKVRRARRAAPGAPAPAAPPMDAEPADPSAAPPTAPPTAPPLSPAATPDHEVFVERDTVVSDNPVLWREMRQPAVGSRRAMIIIACIVGALFLWLYTEEGPQRETPHMIATMLGMFVIILQAAIVAAPTVTNEKDSSSWNTLLTTPLTAWQILLPKMLASVKKLWFVLAIVAAELGIGVLFGAVHPALIVHLAMITVAVGCFLAGTGILFSLTVKRSSAAALLNILLAGGIWLGLPLFAMLLAEFVFGYGRIRNSETYEDFLIAINPMAMAAISGEASVSNARRNWGPWSADFPSGNLDLVSYTGVLFVVCAVGIALGFAALAYATRRFNRYAGRPS